MACRLMLCCEGDGGKGDWNVFLLSDSSAMSDKILFITNKHGSDHPQNDIVLCATHHRAFEADLFAIEPNTLKIYCRSKGPDLSELRTTYSSIEHLPRKPHLKALAWLWEQMKRTKIYTI